VTTRIPPHEVFEAAAWFALPFVALLIALWALAARRANRRAAQFAAEDAHADRQSAWKEQTP